MIEEEFRHWQKKVARHGEMLSCPIRGRRFSNRPEEAVRLGLLHFLVELSSKTPIEVRVEREHHDIDIRWKVVDKFDPNTPPLMIIETKVDDAGGDWNDQLRGYLTRANCGDGIIFTGRRMFHLKPGASAATRLGSLSELSNMVTVLSRTDPLAFARRDFELAHHGDLTALSRLSTRFRYATFWLQLGEREVQCRHLVFHPHELHYRSANQLTRHPMTVPLREFRRLVRVS